MDFRRGRWIGFAVSSLFFALIGLVVLSAFFQWESVQSGLSGFCHQFSDRCYQVHGVTLPICVRCVWIYLGLGVGHTLFLYWKPNSERISRALIGVIGLLILDVLLEMFGLYSNWFWTRTLTGFLFGLVLSHFTLIGLREIFFELLNPKSYVRRKFLSGRTR